METKNMLYWLSCENIDEIQWFNWKRHTGDR